MAKKSKSKAKSKPAAEHKAKTTAHPAVNHRLKEVLLFVFAALAIFFLVTLFTYSPADPGWSGVSSGHIMNAAGRVGAFCAFSLFALLGGFAYLFPILMLYGIAMMYIDRNEKHHHGNLIVAMRVIGGIILFLSGSALSNILMKHLAEALPYGAGGMLGAWGVHVLVPLFNETGSVFVLIVLFLVGLTLFAGVSWLKFVAWAVEKIFRLFAGVGRTAAKKLEAWREKRAELAPLKAQQRAEKQAQKEALKEAKAQEKQKKTAAAALFAEQQAQVALSSNPSPASGRGEQFQPKIGASADEVTPPFEPDNVPAMPAAKKGLAMVEAESVDSVVPDMNTTTIKSSEPVASKAAVTAPTSEFSSSDIPSLDLLVKPKPQEGTVSKEQLEQTAALVEQRLADFGVKAEVVGACPGPIVTRFELQLAPGTKASKLTGISSDLARSMAAHSVRIVEVIPGKPYVGLEVPNSSREMVYLKEVLDNDKFLKADSPLTMGLGKDISGQPSIVNLAKMPHLLVAGTTGSGKSVGVNAMILSMLFKATPEDLRMIMIDPKMLELSIYEGIPHLLTPVVTDMKEAASALRWCVREMDRRYKLMAAMGVRNIAGMNDKVRGAREAGQPLKDPLWVKENPSSDPSDAPDLATLPYIVVIVDEFADMMMVVGKKVEELIARLAQKARASGIHLILATQRPSVDVITGLIKANIPSRMSFQVSSKIDSRTILDQMGAEQLLGYGDMLYLPAGTSVPVRVHGAFVADEEVHAVASAWKEKGEPAYIESILKTDADEEGGDGKGAEGGGDKDALFDEAVAIVLETQRASISSVQRKLRIGYNRAARLLEDMEAAGIVSEVQPNGMREILADRME